MALDKAEMISILEEIARSGKSHGARIDAIKELQKLHANEEEAPAPVPAEKENDFDGLYDVENPGRSRRAS
jgi:hypothetical protein